MTTATQKEMIIALLRQGESFSSAAEFMNKNHLATGQNPYTRSAIAGVAHRAGFRKVDHGIPTTRSPATRMPATPKPRAVELKTEQTTATQASDKSPKPRSPESTATTKKKAAPKTGTPGVKANKSSKTESGTVIEWWSKFKTVDALQKEERRRRGPKNIEELGCRDCRWPTKADPSSGRTSSFYCETPAIEGKPYCAHHLYLAHVKGEKAAA